MKKIKFLLNKVFFIILVVIIQFSLISCKKQSVIIGLLIDSANNVHVNSIIEEIKNNMNKDFELMICYADESQNKQNEQFLTLIDKGASLFVVSLVDRLAANTYVEKCRNIDKAIIFFNKEPLKDDVISYSKAYYVGFNIEKLGLYQSKMVQSLFVNPNFLMPTYDHNINNIIEVVGLKINQGSQTSETMFEMCIKDLREKNFNVKIVATEYISDREEAKEKMKKIYNDPKNINIYGERNIELVITSNDEIALGVLDFLEEIKDNSNYTSIIIISANMIDESISLVENNTIYGSTNPQCQLQGQIILDLVNSIINKKDKIISYVECSATNEYEENTYCTNYSEHYIYVAGEAIYDVKN